MAAIKNKGFVCSKCGQKIIGSGFKYKNNIYCSYNCAQQVAAEDEKQQKQLQNLYQYLKQRFQISDIPLSVIEIIDNKCNSDSGEEPITIGGMKKTIDYYFDILDNTTSEIKYFGWIINTYYNEAKKYYQKQKEVIELNKTININVPAVKVKIYQKQLDKKQKIRYNIKDL